MLWSRFIRFLEKDLKVVQGKSLVSRKTETLAREVKPKPIDRKSAGYLMKLERTDDGKCHFCNEYGHVPTNGPKGSQFLQ